MLSGIGCRLARGRSFKFVKGDGGEDFAIAQSTALILPKTEKTIKIGVAKKRLNDAWVNNYMTIILSNSILKNRMRFPLRQHLRVKMP